MATHAHHVEMLQVVVLLVIDGLFYWLVIPAGIVDPQGFGIDEGLPPSFSARLVAVVAGALLLGRLAQLLVRGEHDVKMPVPGTNPEADTTSSHDLGAQRGGDRRRRFVCNCARPLSWLPDWRRAAAPGPARHHGRTSPYLRCSCTRASCC